MRPFLLDRMMRALQSLATLGLGCAGSFGYLILVGLSMGAHGRGWPHLLIASGVYAVIGVGPYLLAGWAMLLLPTVLLLDFQRGRWTVLIWAAVVFVETLAVDHVLRGFPPTLEFIFELPNKNQVIHSLLIGLPIGTCYGLFRIRTPKWEQEHLEGPLARSRFES